MRRSIILSLVIAAFFANVTMGAIQWKVEDGGNGHYYEAVTVPGITFNDAKIDAAIQKGYLVTITSQAEQDFITSQVIRDGFGYRIGGFQPAGSPEPDGNWQWVTGEAFEYTNWHSGEPNNQLTFGGEDTIVVWTGNQWNDGPGSYNHYEGYILEIVPQPATILILGLGAAIARNRM